MTIDKSALKALAEAATPQDFDSAELKIENGHVECPCCGGEGEVELLAEYNNYDDVAIGVQFYGIGDEFGAAEAYYRAANPGAILDLLAEIERLSVFESVCEGLTQDHIDGGWTANGIRAHCKAVETERDQLKAENEFLKARLDKAIEFQPIGEACLTNRDELRASLGLKLGDSLHEHVEALRKDAERYRWCRRPNSSSALYCFISMGEAGSNLDAMIDKDMAGESTD